MGRVGVSVRPAFGGGHFYHCLPAAAASRGESRVVPRWERRRTGIEGRSRACDGVLTASGKARCARFEACLLTPSPSLCAVSRCRSSSRHLKRKFTLSATKRRRRDDDSTETSATTMFGGQPPRSSRQRGSKRKKRQRRALDALPPLHKCSRHSLGSGRNTCGARKAAGNPSCAPSRSRN